MSAIWHYLTGYVIIKVEGLSLEKFINIMRAYGVSLWDVRRQSYTILTARVNAFSLPRLRRLAGDLPLRLTVVKRRGLSGAFSYLRRRRKGFLLGLIGAVVLFFALTSFLWGVEIEGVEDSNLRQEIAVQLQEMGIYPGVLKAQMDLSQVEKRLLLDNPEIAWTDVRLRGVVLNIAVREADLPPTMQENSRQHIVASKDAVVESVVPLSGQAQALSGQAVKAGDILISGIVTFEGASPIYSTARGEVMGRVFYSASSSRSLFAQERVETGRVATERFLVLGNWRIFLGRTGEEFAQYDTEVLKSEASGLYLPCYVETVEYREVQVRQGALELDEVLEEAQQEAYQEIEGRLPQDAIVEKVGVSYKVSEQGELEASVLVETLEQIGEAQAYTPPDETAEENAQGQTATDG